MQSPFITLFLELDDKDEYIEETALIIEEIIKQRLQGIKNEKGVYITPTFPKLVYLLDENNIHKDSKYRYITDLCIKCCAKRMNPDFISAKIMRENYEGNTFGPMGCRALLSPWKGENGKYKFEGRFNIAAISLNLPQVAILAQKDTEAFWEILDQRLLLIKEGLLKRIELLERATSDTSPIHWQHGAIARLGKHEPIAPLLKNGYATISLGYIGLYEAVKLMTGKSHTEEKEFALEIMKYLRASVDSWKKETGYGFALYGTPKTLGL
ncbi:MAG: hypothetical protein HUJ68_14120 [Clostridia bacterium]|nr:hypothetical protein [Clostridia bacterium]